MESSYIIGSIIVASLATYATRIIPFLLFRTREPSPLVKYIERNMPLMIMVILVFYALKDVKWEIYPYGLAEMIGVSVAIALHVSFKNALLSIFTATLVYMFLIQKVLF
ncbi:branched-chain amino acid transporter permease [Sulfurospirillum barnesii]|uniref:Putative branched-chain amino acid permease n=1 Tax=Sulfurospirillum barnesii (strain ATCC 700032 / DSM 10660 / SES-3) TaxID=760154 RepID=I3XY53_SULBS|nr:AzlD domain-containing protein [Sulfurospirillum barnesii]AFL68877.1 putative branched-chain amino acid permease [Sulfurospirillum barnesii SES-3]